MWWPWWEQKRKTAKLTIEIQAETLPGAQWKIIRKENRNSTYFSMHKTKKEKVFFISNLKKYIVIIFYSARLGVEGNSDCLRKSSIPSAGCTSPTPKWHPPVTMITLASSNGNKKSKKNGRWTKSSLTSCHLARMERQKAKARQCKKSKKKIANETTKKYEKLRKKSASKVYKKVLSKR